MSDHHIQLLMLVVQGLALIGLFLYCIETHGMRKAAQEQLKNSMDQLESYSRPCITFWSELRQGEDVILQAHGATGNLVVRPDGGSYVIQNLGNGLALNLRYYITRNDPQLDQSPNRWRYIPTVPATARLTLVETLGQFNQQQEATFEYSSIGGRRYRSTITLNHHVITLYRFVEI